MVAESSESLVRRKKKRFGGAKDCLEPLTSKRRQRRYATYDIESKKNDTQEAGFTRPFLVGFYDPFDRTTLRGAYQEFRDEPHLKKRPWQRRHIDPGGCIDKLMNVALTPRYSGYIFYAHNGGNFDALFLLAWLREHKEEFAFEVIPIQSTIQVVRVWRHPEGPDEPVKERWDFLDSMKLLPFGLQKACETFGVPGKVDHDLHRHEDAPEWSEYLEQDCRSLAAVMGRFYDLIENKFQGEVGITTPATSINLFRREYLGKHGVQEKVERHRHWSDCPDKMNGRCEGCFHEWVRRGYYGGRTEIFRMWGRRLHYYDINSSYVAAMAEDLPIGERIVEEGGIDWRRFHRRGGKYGGFCECTVRVPRTCPIPPLPNKDAFGKLRFQGTSDDGEALTGVWSLEELALLTDPIVGGRIEHVVKTVWIEMRPMFGRMVEDLWRLRAKHIVVDGQKVPNPDYDEGLSALAKLLGNSGYGKFAMRADRQSIVMTLDAERDENGNATRCFLCGELVFEGAELCDGCQGSKSAMHDPTTEHGGDVWYKAGKVDAPYIIPHVSAHITALARVRLWDYMRQAIVTPWGETFSRWPKRASWKVKKVRELPEYRSDEVDSIFEVTLTADGANVVARVQARDEREARELFRVERTLVEGDVVFLEGREGPPYLILAMLGGGKAYVRRLDQELALVREVTLPQVVVRGGRIFYSDTDSIITDVVIPSSSELGMLKDEFAGELIDYVAVQPKVYRVTRSGLNDEVLSGERFDLAPTFLRYLRDSKIEKAKKDLGEDATKEEIEAHAESLVELGRVDKVTMKGFPKKVRTRENLEKLQKNLEKIQAAKRAGEKLRDLEVVTWEQLEKIRALARAGFRRPPKMAGADGYVSKSFRTEYDKRVITADGNTRTRVLGED